MSDLGRKSYPTWLTREWVSQHLIECPEAEALCLSIEGHKDRETACILGISLAKVFHHRHRAARAARSHPHCLSWDLIRPEKRPQSGIEGDLRIDSLRLSARAKSVLKNHRIEFVSDLTRVPDWRKWLRRRDQCGRKTREEIIRVIEEVTSNV